MFHNVYCWERGGEDALLIVLSDFPVDSFGSGSLGMELLLELVTFYFLRLAVRTSLTWRTMTLKDVHILMPETCGMLAVRIL